MKTPPRFIRRLALLMSALFILSPNTGNADSSGTVNPRRVRTKTTVHQIGPPQKAPESQSRQRTSVVSAAAHLSRSKRLREPARDPETQSRILSAKEILQGRVVRLDDLPAGSRKRVESKLAHQVPPQSIVAASFVVTSTADDGDSDLGDDIVDPPTLRAAIQNVNAGKISSIYFASTLSLITPQSALPGITKACFINGVAAGGNSIIIDGVDIPQSDIADFPGFDFAAADTCWIINVEIRNFPDGGIVSNASMLYVQDCTIHDNNEGGIIGFAGDMLIGSNDSQHGNYIFNNFDTTLTGYASNGEGIYLNQCSATIMNNWIGVYWNGTNSIPAGNKFGIQFENAGYNDILYNVISANLYSGFTSPSSGWGGGNMIYGNYIGINYEGTAGFGNQGYEYGGAGIWLAGSQEAPDTIWNNVISGNGYDGINISFSNHHSIKGNLIGLDAAGADTVANGRYGMYLNGTGIEVAENYVAGNVDAGLMAAGVDSLWVHHNYFGYGLDGSSQPVPDDNIYSYQATNSDFENNSIGGAVYGGIRLISNACYNNSIYNNWIGADYDGTGSHPNQYGIYLYNGTYNNEIRDNVVVFNTQGIVLKVSSTPASVVPCHDNTIAGNLVGILEDSLGNGGNEEDGILLIHSVDNTIGGTDILDQNFVGFNGWSGIRLDDQSNRNHIYNNVVGLNAHGELAGNLADGIDIVDSDSNSVGHKDPPMGNIISGNGESGVLVLKDKLDSFPMDNSIMANLIGTSFNGREIRANSNNGVHFIDARFNNIGVPEEGLGNVISGNGYVGVYIEGDSSRYNTVRNNIVGLNADLDGVVPNYYTGIFIDRSQADSIGGPSATGPGRPMGNIIAGNNKDGLYLYSDPPPDHSYYPIWTVVQSNQFGYISTSNFSMFGNAYTGLTLYNVGRVQVGGRWGIEGNDFQFNGWGTYIGSASDGHSMYDNIMGNNFANNLHAAVQIDSTFEVVIGDTAENSTSESLLANQFSSNERGVLIDTDARYVDVGANSFVNHKVAAVDIGWDGVTKNDTLDLDDGPNGMTNYPVLTKVFINAGNQLAVEGWLSAASNQTYTLRFYESDSYGKSGYGEGAWSFGTWKVTTNSAGFVSFQATFPNTAALPGSYITATATDMYEYYNYAHETSEFSAALLYPAADYAAIKAAEPVVPDTIPPGTDFDFSLTLNNDGDAAVNSLTLSDTLGAGLTVTRVTSSAGSATFSDSTVMVAVSNLGSGQAVNVTLSLHTGTADFSDIMLTVATDPPLLRPADAIFSHHIVIGNPVVSTEDPAASLPKRYALQSIYPNPFNPSTTVLVALPERASLTLNVYNLLGRQVATIASGEYDAGVRKFTLDGSALASGVYFVNARVPGKLNQLRRIVLLK